MVKICTYFLVKMANNTAKKQIYCAFDGAHV